MGKLLQFIKTLAAILLLVVLEGAIANIIEVKAPNCQWLHLIYIAQLLVLIMKIDKVLNFLKSL